MNKIFGLARLKRVIWLICLLLLLNIALSACGNSGAIPAPPAETVLPAGVGPADWPMWGRDARQSGYNSGAVELNASAASNLALRWVYEAGSPVETSPAVVGETLYFNDGRGQVVALNRADGVVRWRYQYNSTSHSSPAFAANKIFFADDSGLVVALNANDGKLLWQHKLDRPTKASPLIENSQLYLATLPDAAGKPGMLVALDLENGATLWQYVLPSGFAQNTPAVAGGAFFLPEAISQNSGGVVRIAKDSQPATFDIAQLNRPAIYAAGQLYTATGRGLAALPAMQRLASPQWFFGANLDATKTETPSAPAASPETLLVPLLGPDGNSLLKSLNAKDGKPGWELKTTGLLGPIAISGGGVAFAGSSEGRLWAVDLKSGLELWTYQTSSSLATRPVVAGDSVYIGGASGQLYAFGRATSNNPASPGGLQVYTVSGANNLPQIFSLDINGKSTPLLSGEFLQPIAQEANWPSVPAGIRAGAVLSPDNRKIAFVSYSVAAVRAKTNLFLMNVDGSNIQALDDANALSQDLAFAPDGKELFFTSLRANSFFRLKLDGPNQALPFNKEATSGAISLPVISADNRFIYFNSYEAGRERGKSGLARIDRDGSNLLLLAREDAPITALTTSPDNRWLAYSLSFDNKPGEIWLRRSTGEQPRKLTEGSGPLAFSPDGKWLSYSEGNNRKLLALDAAANPLPANSNAFNLDGKILTLSWTQGDGKASTPEPGQPQTILSEAAQSYNDPVGKFVFSANGRLYLMNSSATSFALLPNQPAGRNSAPQFSGDGKRLVFVNEISDANSAQIWVWQVGPEAPHQLTFSGRNWWPALSQDGASIAFSSQRNNLTTPEIFLLTPNFGELANLEAARQSDARAKQLTNLGSGAYQPGWVTDNILVFAGFSTKNLQGNSVEPALNLWRLSTDNFNETYALTELVSSADVPPAGILFPKSLPAQNGIFMLRLLNQNGQINLSPAFFGIATPTFESIRSECPGYFPNWLDSSGKSMACVADAKLLKAEPQTLREVLEGRVPAGGIWRGTSLKGATEPVSPPFALLSSNRYPVDGLAWGK